MPGRIDANCLQGHRYLAVWLILVSPLTAADPGWVRASVTIDGCSGTIITADGYGISAGHCASQGKRVEWTGYDNKTEGKARWVHVDKTRDLSLFKIDGKPLHFVTVPQRVPAGPITGCGWPEGKGPTRLALRYSNRERFSNLAGDRWVFGVNVGRFRNGNSGGGIFIGDHLVSVMTHGVDDEWVYGCRHDELIAFLKEARPRLVLSRPVAAKPVALVDGWGDIDRTREIKLLKQRVAELEELVATISKRSPVPGPPGPRGDPGPVGKTDVLMDRLLSLEDWRENFRAIIRVKIAPKQEKNDGS